MSNDLPTEIWLNIVSYLDDVEVKDLYAVNKQLHEVAMDRRYSYRIIDLGAIHDEMYLSKLRYLKHPSISPRVRTLAFSRVPSSSIFEPTHRNFKVLCEILNQFDSITAMDFLWDDESHEDLSLYVPFLSYSLASQSRTLHTIRIGMIPLDSASSLLSSCQLIPNLSRFQMVLPSFLNNDVQKAKEGGLYKDISSFINRHQESLQFLMLRPNKTRCQCREHSSSTFDIEVEEIFHDVKHLKHLRNVYIQPRKSSGHTLRDFLDRHAPKLERLTVFIPHFYKTRGEAKKAATNLYTTALQVEHLSFDTEVYGSNNPATLDFVTRCSSTLVSLVIPTRRLDVADWTMLCSVQWPKLQTLELTLLSATVETFDMISAQFGLLFSLNLTVTCDVIEKEAFYEAFSSDMGSRSYVSPLRALTINMPLFPIYCVDAIVRAFPALVTIGDLSKETYLGLSVKKDVHSSDRKKKLFAFLI